MSSGAPESLTGMAEWRRLRDAIRRLASDRSGWRERALASEERIRELEGALRDVAGGRLDPVALSEQSRRLEEENRLLSRKVEQARETVERIMARLQFTQEES